MLDVQGKLLNEREVSYLLWGPFCRALQCEGQRFLIVVDCEMPAFEVVAKMLGGDVTGEELTIKCTVLPLSW